MLKSKEKLDSFMCRKDPIEVNGTNLYFRSIVDY